MVAAGANDHILENINPELLPRADQVAGDLDIGFGDGPPLGWRREGDSNPRQAFGLLTLSRRAL